MRRLMGIYQNKNGDGAEGSAETNSLFKFARRDSLLGLRNNKPAAENTSKTCTENSTWSVPTPEEKGLSPQEQLLEVLRRRQLLQEHEQQQQQEQQQVEDNSSLEEQIVEMLRQRQLLQAHLRQQLQQQQQQLVAAEESTPSLQEQLLETMERRKMLEGHGQQQQQQQQHHVMDNGNGMQGANTTRLIQEYLIKQQQHHEDHKNKMKLALMAMGSTRFPIRRDTLSRVHTGVNHNEVGGASTITRQSLPWSLSGMA